MPLWSPLAGTGLLERDGGASLFELSLRLLGGLLVDTLEDCAGGAVDDSLGLAESEARERADLLDDLDLLLAGRLEDDVEGILLLDLFDGSSSATGCSNCNGSGRGDLEYLFELLDELAELDERQFLEGFDELFA